MNPRLASPPLDTDPDRARAATDTRGWRWFAFALFAGGLGAGVVLVTAGQRVTGAVAFVVLAALLALAVNRYAFFPSELAVTAEVAVLLAAVVGFGIPAVSGGSGGAGGSMLGPWCLALLAGPLDVLHWRQRSYVRMAYNAGNRMAATLLAAVVFSAVLGANRSPSFATIAVGGLAASVAFAVVEVVVGTVLVRLRTGAAWAAAARVELPMESLTIPLGLVGALAGALGAEVGWWLAPVLLAPAILVPELVLVARLPRRRVPRLGRNGRPRRRRARAFGAARTVAASRRGRRPRGRRAAPRRRAPRCRAGTGARPGLARGRGSGGRER